MNGFWILEAVDNYHCQEICKTCKQISKKLSWAKTPSIIFRRSRWRYQCPRLWSHCLLGHTHADLSPTFPGSLSSSVNCSEFWPSFLSLWSLLFWHHHCYLAFLYQIISPWAWEACICIIHKFPIEEKNMIFKILMLLNSMMLIVSEHQLPLYSKLPRVSSIFNVGFWD